MFDFIQAGIEGLNHDLQEAIRSPIAFEEALFLLEQFSLIRRSEDGIIIHRLVQIVIRDNMTDIQIDELCDSTISLCHSAFPIISPATRILGRKFQDQVMVLLQFNRPKDKTGKLGDILGRVGLFMDYDGKHKQAEVFNLKSLQVLSDLKGEHHPETLSAIHRLQSSYRCLGRLGDAALLGEKKENVFWERGIMIRWGA